MRPVKVFVSVRRVDEAVTSVRQTPLIAKQPVVRLSPFPNEVVLLPETLSAVVVAPVATRLVANILVAVAALVVLRTRLGRKNKVPKVLVALIRASARALVKYRLLPPSVRPLVVVANHAASERYEFKSEKSGNPSDEVETWRTVFPAPPMRSEDEAMTERPVPPRFAARMPVVSASAIPSDEVARRS